MLGVTITRYDLVSFCIILYYTVQIDLDEEDIHGYIKIKFYNIFTNINKINKRLISTSLSSISPLLKTFKLEI